MNYVCGFLNVCGFLIHKPLMLVALVRKQKPAWQAGLLNGIGGKIERLCGDCFHIESVHMLRYMPNQPYGCTECYKNRHMLKHVCTKYTYDKLETPLQAQIREFKEETSVEFVNWQHYCTVYGKQVRTGNPDRSYECHFLRGFAQTMQPFMALRSLEHEQITTENINHITTQNSIPNLPWLLRMALDIDQDVVLNYQMMENYRLINKPVVSV